MRRIGFVPLSAIISCTTLLLIGAAPALAQRTVTKDAGSGRKIVLHYNAADQVTETDTIGPNGELLEKDVLEFRPGAYTPDALNTSYWPNGKIHKQTHNTYDDNANFTGEFVQVFDEAGKQIFGHKLTHDPATNVYRCQDWDVPSQGYKTVQCPAAEESEGTPETVKKFTQQEVEEQLKRARQIAKTPPPVPPAASSAAGATAVREIGFILPAHIRPGERVSGSVVDNPADYENMPQVTVTRFPLPFASSGQGSTLDGWSVELSGEPPQPATGPIALTVPPGQVEVAVMFRAPGNVGAPVSKLIRLPAVSREKAKGAVWQAPATCIKDQVCMVRGAFSGNSLKTFAAFAEQPARILAETTTAVYLAVPRTLDPGPRPLVIAEGTKAVAFPMIVTRIGLRPQTRKLNAGEKMLMYASVDGAEEIPDPLWLPGNFPPTNLPELRKLVPDYQLPRANKEAREEEEKREAQQKRQAKSEAKPEKDENLGGEVVLVVKNSSSDGLTFGGSKDGTYVLHLQRSGFQMGKYKYKYVVSAPKGGTFDAQIYLFPMLAPVAGQEFTVTATQ